MAEGRWQKVGERGKERQGGQGRLGEEEKKLIADY